jgi:hypothetical protein
VVVLLEVVGESHRDAARCRLGECTEETGPGGIREPDVVDRDVEAVLRRGEPVGEQLDDLRGGLAAVGESPELDQEALAARIAALWARFAA